MSESTTAMKTADAAMSGSPISRFSDSAIAYGLLRLTFGINIALHGISRQIGGRATFLAYLNHYFEKTPLIPKESLPIFAFVIMWGETIFGLLMTFGLFTRVALIGGSLVIAMLTVGTNLAQDWGIAGLQLTYALIYFVLLKYREQSNALSIDGMLRK